MNRIPLAVLLALTLPLAACGNKGPLVRPGSAPEGLPPAPSSVAPPASSTIAPPAPSTVAPPATPSTDAPSSPPPADAGHG